MSHTDELSRLADLHRNGDLSDDEFAAAKRKLLKLSAPVISEQEEENWSTAEEEMNVPVAEDASEVYAKLLEDKSIASYSENKKRGARSFVRNKWLIGGAGLLVIALIEHFGGHDSSNSSNIQSPDSVSKQSVDSLTKPRLNFSYQITKESFIGDSSDNWGLVTVELSRKITNDEITVLANRLREAKTNYRNLSIIFLVKGMTDSGPSYATARFDPGLTVARLGSTDEEQRKAALIAKQNIEGKVIGRWHEDGRISSSDVFFEKNGKTYERRIFESGIMEEGSSGQYAGEIMELIRRKIRGSTRFYEKDGLPGQYFVINKDGNLEFYDQDGYITMGLKIQ